MPSCRVCAYCVRIASILLLALTAGSAFGQEKLPEVSSSAIDAIFKKYDSPSSPGCSVGVIKDGQLIFAKGYGQANLEHEIPNTPKTVFYIGSTSKQFTALSIAILVTQGKLKETDTLRRWVPELPAWADQVTIDHLVHHTSGVPDFFALMPLAGQRLEDIHEDGDILRLLERQPRLNFAPGEQFQYSNSGYFLLAVIVNRITGKSLRAFAEETFFGPLRMASTHFHDDRTMLVPRRAAGYEPKLGGYSIFASLFDRIGDGGIMTSIEDIVKWDANYYDGKAGGMTAVKLANTPGKLVDGRTLDYGYGLYLRDYRGLPQVSHGGIYLGFRADLIRFPQQKLSVACFCNLYSVDVSKLAQQVADLYLSKLYTKPDPATEELTGQEQTPAELQRAVGTYLDLNSGMTLVVTLDSGTLKAAVPGSGFATMNLVYLGSNRYKARNSLKSDFEFSLDSKPQVVKLRLLQGPGANTTFLTRIEPVNPVKLSLPEFAGSYYSASLDNSMLVSVNGDRLSFASVRNPVRNLALTAPDTFAGSGLIAHFKRAPDKSVVGFELSDPIGRVYRIEFRRQH